MKKFFIIVCTLILSITFSITVFADLGEPQFKDWYVVCGVEGYNFEDYAYMSNDTIYNHLEPGTKLMVYAFNNSDNTYTLIVEDKNANLKGGMGRLNVSESQLNSKFIEAGKTVGEENGTRLDQKVTGKVTADVGVVLRQGPATTFKSYKTIPYNAAVSYQYTYKYGGHNWGYVTYNGQSGWICIDYVKANATTTKKTTTTTSATEIFSTDEFSTETIPGVTDSSITGYTGQNDGGSDSFFSSTKNVIIFCCMFAVITALTSTVIILLVEKKKQQKNNWQNNNWQNNNWPNNNYRQ